MDYSPTGPYTLKPASERSRVVVIGGGTGTFTVLQGLKKFWGDVYTSKIVSMADSGGSTGRLRDEMGQLPVGDVRMGLAALAAGNDQDNQLLRELFLYRFDKGEGLNGHNFGNLFLVALTEILGSEAQAIKAASRLLRIRGEVLPVTEENVHLIATYDDGVEVMGEHEIDDPSPEREDHSIVALRTDKPAHITEDVARAIAEAELIVLGPGDLYVSLLANCIIKGLPEAIRASEGKFVYVSNLFSRPGQTRGMLVSDYLAEIEAYVGQQPDHVLINTSPLPADVLELYKKEGDVPVEDDLGDRVGVVRAEFLANEIIEKQQGDVLKRALIRHDGDKLARAIIDLL